jgi:hypothetical protein
MALAATLSSSSISEMISFSAFGVSRCCVFNITLDMVYFVWFAGQTV